MQILFVFLPNYLLNLFIAPINKMNLFKYYARLQLIYTIIYAQFGAKITIDSFILIYRKLQIDVMCTSCFFKICQRVSTRWQILI